MYFRKNKYDKKEHQNKRIRKEGKEIKNQKK